MHRDSGREDDEVAPARTARTARTARPARRAPRVTVRLAPGPSGDAHARSRIPARQRARFQPLLLAGSAAVMLPYLRTRDAPVWVVAYVALAVVVGIGAWAGSRRPGGLPMPRQLIAIGMTALAVGGLLLILLAIDPDEVLDLLLLIPALGAVVAIAPARRLSVLLQVVVVASLLVALLVSSLSPLVAVLITLQVGVVVFVATHFAGQLHQIRAGQLAARQVAERRGELLAAVQALPRGSVHAAERAVSEALCELAFDASGIARIEGDQLWERAIVGLPPLLEAVPRGRGLAWRAIEEDRTLVVDDYRSVASPVAERMRIRSVVVTPIRVNGRPVGALMGARFDRSPPTDTAVETLEVLAAHLGGVMANRMSVLRQADLLSRAARLDQMGQGLLESVSEEIRDPLTVLRLGAQVLQVHSDALDDRQRDQLLDRLRSESEELRLVIDTILDFARFHGRRVAPEAEPVPLVTLLAGAGLDRVPDAQMPVLTDPELVVPALALLLSGAGTDGAGDARPRVLLDPLGTEVGVALPSARLRGGSSVVIRLADQLLVAAGARLQVDASGAGTSVWFPRAAPAPARGEDRP